MAKTADVVDKKCKNCGERIVQVNLQDVLTWIHLPEGVELPLLITEMRIGCEPPVAEPM